MNKIALITGASRGIGAATALRLADDGFDICINYRKHEAEAETIAKRVREKNRRAIIVKADVSKEAEVTKLFNEVDTRLGRLTALVNNAGVLFQQRKLTEIDAERIKRVLSVNVTGTLLCCKEAIVRMSKTRGGSGGTIVNVSSGASRTGSPFEYIDYAASKGAVDTLTIGLSQEVAEEGIRVNCVRPGLIYTDMHSDGGESGRVDRLKAKIPLKRGGLAEEVAAAISWLTSPESSFSTGCFIDVSGGR